MSTILFISEIERRERELIFLQNANAKHGKKFDYSKVYYYANNVSSPVKSTKTGAIIPNQLYSFRS